MQEKKANANEPLNDQELKKVSGGAEVMVQPMPHPEIRCTCGHTFFAPYNCSKVYQCPVCGERISG